MKMRKLDKKGQGAVFGWISSLLGIFIVITLWILFDDIMWNKLSTILVAQGLDLTSSYMVILQNAWSVTPVLFILGFIVRIFILSMIREPYQG